MEESSQEREKHRRPKWPDGVCTVCTAGTAFRMGTGCCAADSPRRLHRPLLLLLHRKEDIIGSRLQVLFLSCISAPVSA